MDYIVKQIDETHYEFSIPVIQTDINGVEYFTAQPMRVWTIDELNEMLADVQAKIDAINNQEVIKSNLNSQIKSKLGVKIGT